MNPGNPGYYQSQGNYPPNNAPQAFPNQGAPGHSAPNYTNYSQGPPHGPPHGGASPPIWIPNAFEISLLDGWFNSIDVTGLGVIQGAQAVGFFKRSNLHRDALRKIWSLVDTQNRGYIDKRQFAMIMRLIALSYAHPHVPITIERYYQTCRDDHYPLPPMNGGTDAPVHHHHQQQPQSQSQAPVPQHMGAPPGTMSPPPSLTDRMLNSVPSSVEIRPTDDDAISEFSDFSGYSTPAMVTSTGAPMLRANSGAIPEQPDDDFDDMGDFQEAVSSPHAAAMLHTNAAHEEEEFDDFQGAAVSTPVAPAPAALDTDDFDDFQAAAPPTQSHTSTQPPAQSTQSSVPQHPPGTHHHTDSDSARKKKSIEEMLAMVASDPLNTHAPSLSQWQQQHPHAHSSAPSVQEVEKEEVDLLILDDDVASTSQTSSNLHKANAAMSAFDEIAELDIQASNEEWDDFADETTAPVIEAAPAETSSDNPFDQFLSPEPAATTTTSAQSNAPDAEEDEEFGGFESPPAAPVEVPPSLSFNAAPAPQVNVEQNGDETDDDFGDFASHTPGEGEGSGSGFRGGDVVTPSEGAEDDDDFGDFSSGAGPVAENITSVTAPAVINLVSPPQEDNNDEDFGDFSTSTGADPVAENPAPVTAAASVEVVSPPQEDNDDEDFGDFSSGASPAGGIPAVFSGSVTLAETEDTDEDDFNDFESAPPVVPATPPQKHKPAEVLDIFGDAFGDLVDNAGDDPVLAGLSFTQSDMARNAPERQLSAPDLLDSVLLDSSLYATPPAAQPPVSVVSLSSSASASVGTGSLLDEFIVAPTSSTSGLGPSSSASSLLDLGGFPSSNAQLPDLVDRNLTLDELESLYTVLMDLNYFPEAFGVGKQASAVSKIKVLNSKKMEAVENDDLELAIQLRDEINRVKEGELVASRDEERYWLELAHAGKKKDSVEDNVELIGAIDPACVEKVRAKYVDTAPGGSPSDRALFYANAIRSMQLVVAVRTSHTEHVKCWVAMMSSVSRVLLDALGSIEEYRGLVDDDQAAVRGSDQMNVFLKGVMRVVDVGKWVAASCQEALVETAAAARTLSLCDSVIEAISSCGLMELEHNHHIMTLQDLTDSSSRQLSLIGRKSVSFCNLTLRPINVTPSDDDSQSSGTEMVEYLGLPYMQAAISMWVHNFPNKQLPSNPFTTN